MAEKSSWDQAKIRQKLGLVWRNRKKIGQIIKDYFYLPFFLLIILCLTPLLENPSVYFQSSFTGHNGCLPKRKKKAQEIGKRDSNYCREGGLDQLPSKTT
jgi:hypothetical protein